MKTCAVPVEPTEEMIAAMYDIHPCGPTDKLTRAYKAALAAAPPQPEPADHLAAPDSLERARNALRAITNAGSIGHAKRIAMQALGDTNAAPEQSERESITSPSQEGCAVGTAPAVAPITSSEAVSACPRCGKTGAALNDGHGCLAIGTIISGATSFSGAITSGLTLGTGTTATRLVMGNAGGTNIIAPMPDAPAAPNRRVAQRRVKNPDVWHPAIDKIRRFGSYDRRQNAAGQDCRVGEGACSLSQSVPEPVPAAPTTMNLGERAESTLPLSAEEINAMKGLLGANTLCDQALRAIELKKDLEVERAGNKAVYERAHMLEQQVAGLKSEWFHRGQESVRRKNESGCCCKIDDDGKILSACNAHAEWAGQQLAELEATIARDDENINDLAARECKERQRAEKAEAELAELKARVEP